MSNILPTNSQGYGIVYPSTGASGFKVPEVCVGLGVIGSFEAFVGVLGFVELFSLAKLSEVKVKLKSFF
jgi:hypothetical protein